MLLGRDAEQRVVEGLLQEARGGCPQAAGILDRTVTVTVLSSLVTVTVLVTVYRAGQ